MKLYNYYDFSEALREKVNIAENERNMDGVAVFIYQCSMDMWIKYFKSIDVYDDNVELELFLLLMNLTHYEKL